LGRGYAAVFILMLTY